MTAPARSRRPVALAPWPWILLLAVLAGALAVGVIGAGGPSTLGERARGINESIKCPQCAGQSAADSDAPAARAIRTEVSRRLAAGESDDEIRDYFASRYGESILLTPGRDGLDAIVWFLPVAAFVAAIGGLVVVFRRWHATAITEVADADRVLVESALHQHPDRHHDAHGAPIASGPPA